MSDVQIGAKRYRRNVGVVLFNREGKVWLGRRADTRGERIWQFPQGGVDKGEDLLEAARRAHRPGAGLDHLRFSPWLQRRQGHEGFRRPDPGLVRLPI